MEPSFIPLGFERLSPEESRDRASRFLSQMRRRRTVRDFSTDPIPMEAVDAAIETAASAPIDSRGTSSSSATQR